MTHTSDERETEDCKFCKGQDSECMTCGGIGYVYIAQQDTNPANACARCGKSDTAEIHTCTPIDAQQISLCKAYERWSTFNTPEREKLAFLDGFDAAIKSLISKP